MAKIITTDDLKRYIAKDITSAQAATVVAAVNDWIDSQTGRCWGEVKQVTERYNFKPNLWLRHSDIVSIDEVSVGFPGQPQQDIAANSYYFNPLGRVSFLGNISGFAASSLLRDYLAVKYTYGVTDVPDSLVQAALGIAAGYYNWASNGQKDVVSAGVGSYRVQYSGAVRAGSTGPDAALSTADALFGVIEAHTLRRV